MFAANAFALLGLRPLFFLVAELVARLYYLKTALAVLLIAIGAKMAAGELFGKIGPEYSLPGIALILGTGVVASLVRGSGARTATRSPREPYAWGGAPRSRPSPSRSACRRARRRRAGRGAGLRERRAAARSRRRSGRCGSGSSRWRPAARAPRRPSRRPRTRRRRSTRCAGCGRPGAS